MPGGRSESQKCVDASPVRSDRWARGAGGVAILRWTCDSGWQTITENLATTEEQNGAGDGIRTHNIQLGKQDFRSFIFSTKCTCMLCMPCLIWAIIYLSPQCDCLSPQGTNLIAGDNVTGHKSRQDCLDPERVEFSFKLLTG